MSLNPFDEEGTRSPHERHDESGFSTNPFDKMDNDDTQPIHVPPNNRRVTSSRRSSNPFDEEDNEGGEEIVRGAHVPQKNSSSSKVITSPLRRQSGLLSSKEPIDVSTLSENEKKLIVMGVSIESAREHMQKNDDINSSLISLSPLAYSIANRRSSIWGAPFQVKVTGSIINSSAAKPFTEYSMSVMPRGSNGAYLLKKRYSQFCDLHLSLRKDLQKLSPKGLQFAFADSRYQVFKPTDEERREMLNAWLIGLILEPKYMLDLQVFHKIAAFLNYFENIVVDDIVRGVSIPTLFS